VVQADLRDQALEAGPARRARARLAKDSSSITRTRSVAQPSSPARAANPYWSRVDSWCTSTCWGVDCRTYTTASRSWCQSWILPGEPPPSQDALAQPGARPCDRGLGVRWRSLMTPLLPQRGHQPELPLHHPAEQRHHLPTGRGGQLVPEREGTNGGRYAGRGGARSTDRLSMRHPHFPLEAAGLSARSSTVSPGAAARLAQSWAGRFRLSMLAG